MSSAHLPAVELDPEGEPTHSVIWLHGLGADGNDFPPIVPELGLAEPLRVRFVFPHAPIRPVTVNNGMAMRAWYDIRGLDLETGRDVEGLRRSADDVAQLVEREIERGVPSERIVLAGFSQGGAVAMHLALRYPTRLAGLIALSTYMLTGESLDEEASEANRDLPVFQGHGSHDPLVLPEWGVAARDRMVAHGCDVVWGTWPMEHHVCQEEIQELGAWMRRTLVVAEASR